MNLPQAIADVAASTPARVGLAVESLDGAWAYCLRPDDLFAQASAIKTPILWTLHRLAAEGRLSLDERLAVEPSNGAGGCGLLQHFRSGASELALVDLAVAMIVLSDNVATNLLIDRLGFDAVNALLEDLGTTETRLRRRMIDPIARAAGSENTSTPLEAVRLMRRLQEEAVSDDPAARETLRVLRLPKRSPVTAALPPGVVLATKPGMLGDVRTEWSLVESGGKSYAMALMADGADDAVLEPLFRRLAAVIHEHAAGVG